MSALTLFLVTPSTRTERLFSPHTTLYSLRQKVEQLTGLPSSSIRLRLPSSSSAGQTFSPGDGNDERTLLELGVADGATIVCESGDAAAVARLAALDDDAALQGVEKFELTTEEYERRRVRAYKERNRIGRFADASTPSSDTSMSISQDLPGDMMVDARCELREEGRRGRIAFVGETAFASGNWIGIELDEPKEGKGDGSVSGQRYFECRRGHAVFVRHKAVDVGDFPERDLMDEDEEM